jgi:hypothetical protein
MTLDIKPIETLFKGHRFRSRLEARWAVLFGELGIEFWYEPEGFTYNGVSYLPDFYLPQLRLYAEVKPDRLDPAEMAKAEGLCLRTLRSVVLLIGPPDFTLYSIISVMPGDPYPTTTNTLLDIDWHGRKHFNKGKLFCDVDLSQFSSEESFSKAYRAAVYAARSARFEEGA